MNEKMTQTAGTSRPLRVGVCGAFDISNYGDLLFPLILEAELEARGVEAGWVQFGPHGGQSPLAEVPVTVHPLSSLAEYHTAHPLDALIVGGGALVHCRNLFPTMPTGEEATYRIGETWITPAVVGAEQGIPVLWNAPDAPYEIPSQFKDYARELISVVRYLSVRNESSQENLQRLGIPGEAMVVTPDTAFGARRLLEEWGIGSGRAEAASPYVLVHLNRFMEDKEVSEVAKTLDNYARVHGINVKLLELAQAHRDHEMCQKMADLMETDVEVLQPKTCKEATKALADAALYVGVSYHGFLLSVLCGVPAVAFNYMNYEKTVDVTNELGLQTCHVTTAGDLASLLGASGAIPVADPQLLEQHEKKVSDHFDNLVSHLLNPSPDGGPKPSFAAAAASMAEMAEELQSVREHVDMLDSWVVNSDTFQQEQSQHIQEFEKFVRAKLAFLEDSFKSHQRHVVERNDWILKDAEEQRSEVRQMRAQLDEMAERDSEVVRRIKSLLEA